MDTSNTADRRIDLVIEELRTRGAEADRIPASCRTLGSSDGATVRF